MQTYRVRVIVHAEVMATGEATLEVRADSEADVPDRAREALWAGKLDEDLDRLVRYGSVDWRNDGSVMLEDVTEIREFVSAEVAAMELLS